MNNKVLVADDEEDVLNLVSSNLKNAGFTVIKAADGSEALARVRNDAPALIVLDLMLPGLSGLEVCRLLKSDPATAAIPIIMLTAKAEEIDRIVGLELGADDYITKPFSPRELVLRVKSVLRRNSSEGPENAGLLKTGDITVDRGRHIVRVKNKAVELTATEFKLLTLLIESMRSAQPETGR